MDKQMIPSPEIIVKLDELNSWRNQRVSQYGQLGDQLNMLFDDIDSGKFGEQAKTGSWYQHIKQIKANIVKPDVDVIRAEIDVLIQQEQQ